MWQEKSNVEIILDVLKEAERRAYEDAAPRELRDRTNRELAIIADLVEDEQIRGDVLYQKDGVTVRGVAMGGIRLKGRLFRDELIEKRKQRSLFSRLGKMALALGGWIAGVATVLLGELGKFLLGHFH